ncbi:outer membrane beta-barrel protein [Arcticibacter tournemirensis]|uniref:TonB-dependent receptor n=1 Tax=Arcticibacter tournemirensis TaxID=699437 RepID=A0A4Q0MEI7_9SPHI|nr:outer membrane beta-barrel protein [Arcticibacter tournemirensis]RXF71256.1 TonB-dependent receptor [Arcticibacter tournemirensis]
MLISFFVACYYFKPRISKNKQFLYLVYLFLFSSQLFAAEAGQLSGKVTDADTGESLEYAVVTLYRKPDNSITKSTKTDEDGQFRFENIPTGTYRVKISYVGYLADTLENVVMPERGTKKLPTIKLKRDTKMLGEVVITESKPEIQFGADTITYNVGQSILAEGSMATDILKNVPMVDVDIDGKVSIAGKRNTRIFINGKPSDYMVGNMADLLSVLPSDAIDKIEVITNPEVRYSADGEGIVNIVLKKGYKIGLNGTLSVNAGTRGTYTGTAYIAYRTENLVLGSSYGYKNNDRATNSYSLTQNYKQNVVSSYRNRYNNGDNNSNAHNFRANADWDMTPNQNFSISINTGRNSAGGDSWSDDYRLNSSEVQQELRNQSNSNNNNSVNVIVDADYTIKLNKKKNEKLEIGFITSINNTDQARSVDRTVTRINESESAFLQHADNELDGSGFQTNADYARSLGKMGTFIAGLQASVKKNDNQQNVSDYDFALAQDTVNQYLTNKFSFFENIYSAYAGYNLRSKKRWSFKVGTRAELTDASFNQSRTNGVAMQPYFNIFPNASVSKTFNKKYVTGINYSVRINRPRENALNPLIDNRDSTNISYGNPALKPSVTQQAELSFSTFGRTWSVAPRVSFSKTDDIIERIRIPVDDSGNIETTYRNLATSNALTFSLFGNYRPGKKVSTNAGFTISHITYHSDGNIGARKGGLSYRCNFGLALKLPEKIAFEGNLNYHNNASAQGRSKGSLSSSFGARKLFLQNKLVFRIISADLFSQKSNREFIEGLNYTQERYSSQATRNFSVALSYRFTKTGRNTVNRQKKDIREKGNNVLDEEE